MNNYKLIGFFCFLIAVVWAGELKAADLTGKQIMEGQKERHEAPSEFEQVKMVLVDSSNNKEVRELRRFSKKAPDGLCKFLVIFDGPADVRGTALLTWQQKQREDDQWLYLPALGEKLKRIAQGGKKGYFMGTDFAYEDLRPEKLEDHLYNVIRQESLDGKSCYVVEALPATDEEKRASGYGRRLLWITTDTLFTLKVEFYDQSSKLLKTSTCYDVKTVSGLMMRAGKVLMTHHQNNHSTVMGSVELKIGSVVEDSVFTERFILGFK